jgi:hypothetical protein
VDYIADFAILYCWFEITSLVHAQKNWPTIPCIKICSHWHFFFVPPCCCNWMSHKGEQFFCWLCCLTLCVCMSAISLPQHRRRLSFLQHLTKTASMEWNRLKFECLLKVPEEWWLDHSTSWNWTQCHIGDYINFGMLEILLSLSSPLAFECTLAGIHGSLWWFCGKVTQQIQKLRMRSVL